MIADLKLFPEIDLACVKASVTDSAVLHHGSAENVSAALKKHVSSSSLLGHNILSGFYRTLDRTSIVPIVPQHVEELVLREQRVICS